MLFCFLVAYAMIAYDRDDAGPADLERIFTLVTNEHTWRRG